MLRKKWDNALACGESCACKLISYVSIAVMLLSMVSVSFGDSGVNAAPYLREGVGARSLGMGHAFIAIADDATSGIWNPAGLPKIDDLSFTLYTAKLSLDRKHNFLGIAKKLNDTSSIGFAWINAGVADIPERTADDEFIGRFPSSENAFSISYGRALEKINLGVGIKILTNQFDTKSEEYNERSIGFGGIDLGVLGTVYSDNLSYGVALRNLGGKIADGTVPMVFDAGIALSLEKKIHSATLAFSLEKEFVDLSESTTTSQLGVEYWFSKVIALRGGIQQSYDRRSLFAGFGVRIAGLQLDYALRPTDDTANQLGESSHYVSLSYTY